MQRISAKLPGKIAKRVRKPLTFSQSPSSQDGNACGVSA